MTYFEFLKNSSIEKMAEFLARLQVRSVQCVIDKFDLEIEQVGTTEDYIKQLKEILLQEI